MSIFDVDENIDGMKLPRYAKFIRLFDMMRDGEDEMIETTIDGMNIIAGDKTKDLNDMDAGILEGMRGWVMCPYYDGLEKEEVPQIPIIVGKDIGGWSTDEEIVNNTIKSLVGNDWYRWKKNKHPMRNKLIELFEITPTELKEMDHLSKILRK